MSSKDLRTSRAAGPPAPVTRQLIRLPKTLPAQRPDHGPLSEAGQHHVPEVESNSRRSQKIKRILTTIASVLLHIQLLGLCLAAAVMLIAWPVATTTEDTSTFMTAATIHLSTGIFVAVMIPICAVSSVFAVLRRRLLLRSLLNTGLAAALTVTFLLLPMDEVHDVDPDAGTIAEQSDLTE